jgi:hypothetical protein
MDSQAKLKRIYQACHRWRAAHNDHAKRCLAAVRWACSTEDLHLPMSDVDYPGQLAIDCGKKLLENPAHWGWKQIHSPLKVRCLVFFKQCGKLPDGRTAGHIGIYDPLTGVIEANEPQKWGPFWAKRIFAAFVPLD